VSSLKFGTGQRPSPQLLPSKKIQLPLVWPIGRLLHQSGTNWILDNVLPLLIVAFALAQLRIPEMALPDWSIVFVTPMSRTVRLPKHDPFLE